MFQSKDSPEILAIEEVVGNYFDGYLHADSEVLLKAFHPVARLFSSEDGKLDKTETSDWLKNLEDRKEKGDIRQAKVEILGIDISGNAAVAKTKLQFSKFYFTDYLSLLQIGSHWRVVNKIYSVGQFEPENR